MMQAHPFRVVGAERAPRRSAEPVLRIRLRDLLPLLMHAQRYHHAWLRDLGDDEVQVTPDLAELLAEFRDVIDDKRRA